MRHVPVGILAIPGNGRSVSLVAQLLEMPDDIIPARSVVPAAVDEDESQHA